MSAVREQHMDSLRKAAFPTPSSFGVEWEKQRATEAYTGRGVHGAWGLTQIAVSEPVSLCLHVTYAQVQTNNLGVSLNTVS